MMGMAPSASGINVDEYSALNYSAIWAATRLISEPIASIPYKLLERTKKGGHRDATDEPLFDLWAVKPNPETLSYTWLESRIAQILLWGNGYAEIERNRAGEPIALWQLVPKDVRPDRDKAGRLIYKIHNENGERTIPAENMWHVPGLGFDGLVGYNVIRMAREMIGLGIAAERFGSTFFGNGCQPGGVIEHPGNPTKAAREESRRAIEAQHQGTDRAHRVMMLWGGIKFNRDAGLVPPEEAQMLETRLFQREEVALWFNIPPMKMGLSKTATYASAEQFAVDYVVHTLRPWAVRIEAESNAKLLTAEQRKRFYHSFRFDALLRGDLASRTTSRAKQFLSGAITLDEWREEEDLNPIEDGKGKVHYIPANMIELGEEPPTPAMPGKAPPPDQEEEKPPAKPSAPPAVTPKKPKKTKAEKAAPMIEAQKAVMVDVLGRLYRKQCAAITRASKKPEKFLAAAEEFFAGFGPEIERDLAAPLRIHSVLCQLNPGIVEVRASNKAAAWAKQCMDEVLEAADASRDKFDEAIQQLCLRWGDRPVMLAESLAREERDSHGS